MTILRRWRFTAVQLRTLWESAGRDVLPYPLRHWYAEQYREDSLRLRRVAAGEVHRQLDEDLVHAMTVLLEPEARIEVAGFRGARNEVPIRAHAAAHYQHGVLAIQHPGPEPDQGGDVDFLFLSSDALPAAVIDVLPECAPGQGDPLSIPVTELEKPPPVVRDAWRTTPREDFDRFFNRPTTSTTHVAVYPFGSIDNRHIKGRKDFQVTDFADDGRYVSFGSRTMIAKPTDRRRLTATVAEMLTRTVTEVRDGDHVPH
ncbi:ESX secretion-associated protein EspG [Nocardia callitridis]|uniref:ESX secretion-associated protein EspG n=1 Tax=Nocardia callitridis TaxID=648753 RepID=A0ABP9KKC3_9NOCA